MRSSISVPHIFSVIFSDHKVEAWESWLCQADAHHAVQVTMPEAQKDAGTLERDGCSSWPASLMRHQAERRLWAGKRLVRLHFSSDQGVLRGLFFYEMCPKQRWWKVSDVLWIHTQLLLNAAGWCAPFTAVSFSRSLKANLVLCKVWHCSSLQEFTIIQPETKTNSRIIQCAPGNSLQCNIWSSRLWFRRSPAELTLLLSLVPSNEKLLKHAETISKAKLLFFTFCCWKLSLWNSKTQCKLLQQDFLIF